MNKKKIIQNVFFTRLICILTNVIIGYELIDLNIYVYVLLVVNGTIALTNMILSSNRQSISLNFFVNFFFYLFFFVVPVIHYHFNYFNYFHDSNATYEYAEYSLFLLLIFNIIFSFGIFHKTSFERNNSFMFVSIDKIENNQLMLWSLIGISIIVIGIVGPQTLLLRSSLFAKSSSDSMLSVMSFSFFFRPLVFFVALIEFQKRRKTKRVFEVNFLLILFIAILLNLPSSTARFYTLFIFIVTTSTLFLDRITNKYLIPFLLTFGVNFSFFFSNLRFLSSISDLSFTNTLSFDTKSFISSIHFDAFEVSLLALKFVNKVGLTYGENILGAFLFFIPRFVWTSKPEPSGVLIINNRINNKPLDDESFTNISFPLISELYIAFGLIGVILLAYFFRKVVITIDRTIKASIENKKDYFTHLDLNIILLSSIISLSIFILRGTLMVSYAYSLSIVFSFFLSLKFTGIKYKFKI